MNSVFTMLVKLVSMHLMKGGKRDVTHAKTKELESGGGYRGWGNYTHNIIV